MGYDGGYDQIYDGIVIWMDNHGHAWPRFVSTDDRRYTLAVQLIDYWKMQGGNHD